MGYIQHHAIVVTGTYDEWIESAHVKAVDLFGETQASAIVNSKMNGTKSFFVGPDGSKEGWEDSDRGDRNRDKFIAYLDGLRYEDGSSPLSWVEVLYGDDEGACFVVHHDKELKG